ncbi:MAG: hypothetical protein WDM79_12905 [Terricaulis sp.]
MPATADRVEKLVLVLFLAPTLMGVVALLLNFMPTPQIAPAPLLDLGFIEFAASAPTVQPQATEAPPFPWGQASVTAFAWIYTAGAFIAVLRLIGAQIRLGRVAARAVDASAQWGERTAMSNTDAPAFVSAGKQDHLAAHPDRSAHARAARFGDRA